MARIMAGGFRDGIGAMSDFQSGTLDSLGVDLRSVRAGSIEVGRGFHPVRFARHHPRLARRWRRHHHGGGGPEFIPVPVPVDGGGDEGGDDGAEGFAMIAGSEVGFLGVSEMGGPPAGAVRIGCIRRY